MRKRRIGVFVLVAAGVLALLPIVVYRLPSGPPEVIEGAVSYRAYGAYFDSQRSTVEEWIGNQHVYIGDDWRKARRLYVSASDYSRLELSKNTTFVVRAQARPLFFGGYGRATLLSVEERPEAPVFTK